MGYGIFGQKITGIRDIKTPTNGASVYELRVIILRDPRRGFLLMHSSTLDVLAEIPAMEHVLGARASKVTGDLYLFVSGNNRQGHPNCENVSFPIARPTHFFFEIVGKKKKFKIH